MLRKNRFPPDSLKCESFIASNETEEQSIIKQAKKSGKKKHVKKTKKGKREQGTDKIEVHLPAEVFFSGKLNLQCLK